MNNAERAQAQAQRLLVLGMLSEEPELKAKVDEAHAALKVVLDQHGDAGKLALVILTCDMAIEGT